MRILVVYEAGTSPTDRAITLIEERLGDGMAAPHPLASHVFIVIVRDDGTLVGYEAIPPRARAFPPSEKAGRVLRAYDVPCTQQQAPAVRDAAAAMVGRAYAYDAIAGTLLSLVEGHPETFWGDPAKRVDCIESVALILRGAGIPFCGDTPAFDLTPSGGEQDTAAHCPRAINWLPLPTPTLPEAA